MDVDLNDYPITEKLFLKICSFEKCKCKCQSNCSCDELANSLLELLDYYKLREDTIRLGLVYAASSNNIFVLDWLMNKNVFINDVDILYSAIDHSQTGALDWYLMHNLLDISEFESLVKYVFVAAPDKKKMLDWFKAHGFDFTRTDYYQGIIESMIYDNYQDGFEWLKLHGYIKKLKKDFNQCSIPALREMPRYLRLKLTKWLDANYPAGFIIFEV